MNDTCISFNGRVKGWRQIPLSTEISICKRTIEEYRLLNGILQTMGTILFIARAIIEFKKAVKEQPWFKKFLEDVLKEGN